LKRIIVNTKFFVIICFLFFACSTSKSGSNKSAKEYKQNVEASYYADKFNGKKTASGEIFNNSKLTAAHRDLSFGTKVRVTNIANKKSVEVIINDRGPFKKSREIDLSKTAFLKIADNINQGVIKVDIQILN
jgi:rare lipoprotein A